MSIFALLFKFWPEFCKFQSNPESDKILASLEKKMEKDTEKMEGITAKVRLIKFQVAADELNNMSKDTSNKISLSQPDPKLPNLVRFQALHSTHS